MKGHENRERVSCFSRPFATFAVQAVCDEQRRCAEKLDGMQAQVSELKRLQAQLAAELERLSGAVLAQAFKGDS